MSHEVEVEETWEDGERVITARNVGSNEPLMTLRTAALCPGCVVTGLRLVLEQFEAGSAPLPQGAIDLGGPSNR